MDKLTDAEIVKALERCGQHRECCYCNSVEECGSKRVLTESCLDLINRQKAEIDILKAENDRLQTRIGELIRQYNNDIGKVKSEGIKEFAIYLIVRSDKKGRIHVSDLPDYVCDFLSEDPKKVEHDSLCETETYKGALEEHE